MSELAATERALLTALGTIAERPRLMANCAAMWDNWSAPGSAGNTIRGLTRSSDSTREKAGMKPTGASFPLPLDPEMCADIVSSEQWLRRVSEMDNGCIEWTGARSSKGYGNITVSARSMQAHRVAYVASHSRDIPRGLVLDHLCRNRACVNPAHLDVVSQRINVLRGEAPAARQAAQTACIRGHELKPRQASSTRRYCPTCDKSSKERRRAVMNEARRILGLTQTAYVELHGQSVAAATAIITAHEETK